MNLLLRERERQWNRRALVDSHCWGLHLGTVGLGSDKLWVKDKITEPLMTLS